MLSITDKMMSLSKVCGTVCLILLLAASVAAQDANVKVTIYVKPVVSPADADFFWYNITADKPVTVMYAPSVKCPSAPMALVQYQEVQVSPSKPLQDTYASFSVSSSLEPQVCEAKVEVLLPVHLVEKRTFEISALPTLPMNVDTCKDAECRMPMAVFFKGESVFIKYAPEVDAAVVTFTLPDKSKQQLSAQSPFVATQLGTYVVDIAASKQGYKPVTKRLEFAVITGGGAIASRSVCNGNGVCDANENSQACPQDCNRAPVSKAASKSFVLPVIVIVVVLFIVGAFVVWRKRQEPEEVL